MAFASLIFIYFIIIGIALGIVFIIGLVLFFIGLENKIKPENAKKIWPILLKGAGIAVMILPVIGAGAFAAKTAAPFFREKFTKYENITDKWKSNAYVSDNGAAYNAIESLLTAADEGNREKFAKIFTQELQNRKDFEDTLDIFFESYPTGLSQCRRDGGYVSSSGSSDLRKGSTQYSCTLDGEQYYIYLWFCYKNTDDPDKVGVTRFQIENQTAYDLDRDYESYDYLICDIVSKSDTKRIINGMELGFDFTPERIITDEQFRDNLLKYGDMEHIREEFGDPNSTERVNTTRYKYYYELEHDEMPRYACVDYVRTGGIYCCYVCTQNEKLYDLWTVDFSAID